MIILHIIPLSVIIRPSKWLLAFFDCCGNLILSLVVHPIITAHVPWPRHFNIQSQIWVGKAEDFTTVNVTRGVHSFII